MSETTKASTGPFYVSDNGKGSLRKRYQDTEFIRKCWRLTLRKNEIPFCHLPDAFLPGWE